jgi:hypothetical protein
MISMIVMLGNSQTNLINWIFFVLNIISFAFIAKSDDKDSTNNHSYKISVVIKYYSAIILITYILFISFIGD